MSNQSSKVFVLVHGSFHGAWAFERLAPLLVQEGHQVIARDLPGHGLQARFPRSYLAPTADPEVLTTEPSPNAGISLQDCSDGVIATIRQVAERTPGREIVLVGHSFGGLVLHRVGEAVPDLVGRIVYLSAFMNPVGTSANDSLAGPEFASSSLPAIAIADPTVTGAFRINPRSDDAAYRALLRATLAADVDDDLWEAVTHLLTPDTPAGPHAEPATITADRWGSIARTYISCTADQAMPVAAQQLYIREADALTPDNRTDVREIASSHSSVLSQPEELAGILLAL